jgi:hypothetical protein
MIELTSVDEISDYLDQRQLYGMATMIKRDRDKVEGEPANTYLALAVAAPPDRYGERPVITSADGIAFRWPAPAWSADVVGTERPLGYIDEVGALGGAGGSHEPGSGSVEIAAPAQSGGENGGQR